MYKLYGISDHHKHVKHQRPLIHKKREKYCHSVTDWSSSCSLVNGERTNEIAFEEYREARNAGDSRGLNQQKAKPDE